MPSSYFYNSVNRTRRDGQNVTSIVKHYVAVWFDGRIVLTRCERLPSAAAGGPRRSGRRGARARYGHDAQFDAVGVRREDVDDATAHVADGRRRRAARRLADRREHAAGARLRRWRHWQRVGAGLRRVGAPQHRCRVRVVVHRHVDALARTNLYYITAHIIPGFIPFAVIISID